MTTKEKLTPYLTQKYGQKIKDLGEGTYGQVMLYEGPNGHVAIKKMEYGLSFENDPPEDLNWISINEILVNKHLSKFDPHFPHITNLLDYDITSNLKTIYLVFEYANGGDLLHDEEAISEYDTITRLQIVKNYIYQMLSGLAYIHSLDIIHTDITPSNIFVFYGTNFKDTKIKIGDFGTSIPLECSSSYKGTKVTTLNWRAPELLLPTTHNYDQKIDIWSAGCIVYYLLTRSPPFAIMYKREELNEILYQQATKDMGSDYIKTWKYNRHLHQKELDLLQLTEIWKILGTIPEETADPNNSRGFQFNPEKLKRYQRNYVHYQNNQYKPQPEILLEQLKKTKVTQPEIWYGLLMKMLQLNPKNRSSAYELLRDPLFDSVRKIENEVKPCDCLGNLIRYSITPNTPPDIINNNKVVDLSLEMKIKPNQIYSVLQLCDQIEKLDTSTLQIVIYLTTNVSYHNPDSRFGIEDFFDKLSKLKSNTLIAKCTKVLKLVDFNLILANPLDIMSKIYLNHNENYKLSRFSLESLQMAQALTFYIRVSKLYWNEDALQISLLSIALAQKYYGEKFSYSKSLNKELWPTKNTKLDLESSKSLDILFLIITKPYFQNIVGGVPPNEAITKITNSEFLLDGHQIEIKECLKNEPTIEKLDMELKAPYFDLSRNNYELLKNINGNKALVDKLLSNPKVKTPKTPDLDALNMIIDILSNK